MFTKFVTLFAVVACADPTAAEVANEDQDIAQAVEAFTAALAAGIPWTNQSLALQHEMEIDNLGLTDLSNETEEDPVDLDLTTDSQELLAMLEKEAEQQAEDDVAAVERGQPVGERPEWMRGAEEEEGGEEMKRSKKKQESTPDF
mmetsp:Transcript_88564/g.202624  ORF Transcript_88564/g.202624 Transcript_88564/m.202624 type:complete len:145 (-) Transcript_88564:30-464(-)